MTLDDRETVRRRIAAWEAARLAEEKALREAVEALRLPACREICGELEDGA